MAYPMPSAYSVGERVQLHPGTDLWMRGARFGTIVKIGSKYVYVRMDHPQVKRPVRIIPELLDRVFV